VTVVGQTPLRIVTWNVNSVRARLDRLLAFLVRHEPDVVCLQELKVTDADFPREPLYAAGWRAVTHGQKTYNGVAILAREEPADVERGMGSGDSDPEARLIAATVRGVRVVSAYVPNGKEVGSEKWAYKQRWLGRLEVWAATRLDTSVPAVLCGDFNIAPEERDAKNPDKWRDSVLCHPDARAAFGALKGLGLVDALRKVRPDDEVFTWWDYRELGFQKNDGLRIDHFLLTPPLAARLLSVTVDRDERKGKLPSDHAPVIAAFAEPGN
jgi:exodeoxyribonuclease-3